MLEKEKVIADVCWNTFQWQDYVISGELKQFTNSLSKLTGKYIKRNSYSPIQIVFFCFLFLFFVF